MNMSPEYMLDELNAKLEEANKQLHEMRHELKKLRATRPYNLCTADTTLTNLPPDEKLLIKVERFSDGGVELVVPLLRGMSDALRIELHRALQHFTG